MQPWRILGPRSWRRGQMIDEIRRLLAADLAEGETGEHLNEAADRALALAAAGAAAARRRCTARRRPPRAMAAGRAGVDGLRSVVDSAAGVLEEPSDQFRLRLADRFYGGPGSAPPGSRPWPSRWRSACCPWSRLVRQASLWELDRAERPVCTAYSGSFPTERARELARGALLGGGTRRTAGLLLAAPVTGGGRPVGVIVTRPEPGSRALSVAVLREVAPAIGAVLERGSLLERRAEAERSVAEASERRLTRLAFDLHDGPLQNVAGISGDLAMLRRRLQTQLEDSRLRIELLGSIDDLEARLRAIDTELRDISHSLESPAVPSRPFAEVLESEVQAFMRHSDIRPHLELRGQLRGTHRVAAHSDVAHRAGVTLGTSAITPEHLRSKSPRWRRTTGSRWRSLTTAPGSRSAHAPRRGSPRAARPGWGQRAGAAPGWPL